MVDGHDHFMVKKGLIDGIAILASLADITARSLQLSRQRIKPRDPARVSSVKSHEPRRASSASNAHATPSESHAKQTDSHSKAAETSTRFESPSESVKVPMPQSQAAEDRATAVSEAASTPIVTESDSGSVPEVPPTPQRSISDRAAANRDFRPPRLSDQNITYSAVPSTRLGRLFHYGGLAADVGFGALSQAIKGREPSDGKSPQYPLNEASVRRLVSRMSRMRGAALKIGQFASMQGAKVLPPQIEEIMLKVQHSAHYMPEWQIAQVMSDQLGVDWKSKYGEFDMRPMAAASIGQVHFARLHDGTPLAVKVQFPGVAKSVQSDIRNIGLLLQAGALLPKGLFLENSLAVLGRELADECDYRREAAYGEAFRRLLAQDEAFAVPAIIGDLSAEQVLTTEFATGRTLHNIDDVSQALRDEIGAKILRLCLREIFHFRLMQTDPNWSNFLWQADQRQIELIDFGAGRKYSDGFVDSYLGLLRAAISGDRQTCVDLSRQIGYLTGEESAVMEEAHYQSMAVLGEPFQPTAPRPFSFRDQTITDRVRAQVPIMLKHRLTPPPKETYSLNRKLSGCFLLCARLGSRVDCVGMLDEVSDVMAAERDKASRVLSTFGTRLD